MDGLLNIAPLRRRRSGDSLTVEPPAKLPRIASPALDASTASMQPYKAEIRASVQAWASETVQISELRADAVRRILACLEEESAESPEDLCLDDLGLTSLPPNLDRLHLSILDLRGNRLTHLPMDSNGGGFPGLKELILSDNPRFDVSQLGRLTSLTWLDLEGVQISELPDSLNTLTKLKFLDLKKTGLKGPPRLDAFTQLRTLSLESNRLMVAPDLNELVHLKRVSLGDNRLVIPPVVSRLTRLRNLDLRNNRLLAMPEVPGLTRLWDLHLEGNLLPTLPGWLRRLPPDLSLHLEGNPLAPEAIHRLVEFALQRDKGVNLGTIKRPKEEPPASLLEQVERWLTLVAAPFHAARQALQARWATLRQEVGAGHFAELLRQLASTAAFQNGDATRLDLMHQVCLVLQALSEDDELRARCFASAEAGLGTCGDGVALAFSNIELAVEARALAGKPDALWNLASRHFRLKLLEQIALEDCATRQWQDGRVEEVEVVLAYRIMLAQSLDLPRQPTDMLYGGCVRLSNAQLENARQRVLAAENAPDDQPRFILALPFWQEGLRQQAPCAEAIARLDRRRQELGEALEKENDAPGSTLQSHEYDERYRKINADYETALQEIYRQFTLAFVEDRLSARASHGAATGP